MFYISPEFSLIFLLYFLLSLFFSFIYLIPRVSVFLTRILTNLLLSFSYIFCSSHSSYLIPCVLVLWHFSFSFLSINLFTYYLQFYMSWSSWHISSILSFMCLDLLTHHLYFLVIVMLFSSYFLLSNSLCLDVPAPHIMCLVLIITSGLTENIIWFIHLP